MRYTFYVFKPEVTHFDQVFTPSSLAGNHPYEMLPLRNIAFSAQAYVQTDKPSTPGWLEFVGPYCDLPAPASIRNRSNSFVLVIRTASGSMCALTYGQGFLALNKKLVKRNFGLEAACRLLSSTSIKEMESKATGSNGLHKLQIATRSGDVTTFPIQRTRDHIHKLGGDSPDPALGKRITGATSCMIGGQIAFTRIGEVCERLVASQSLRPNPRLAALRPYEPVADDPTIASLNRRLLAALTLAGCSAIGLYLPEAEDWKSAEQFECRWNGEEWVQLAELDIADIVSQARAAVGTRLTLEQLRVRGLTGGGTVVFDELLANLASFDTQNGNKAYALKDGEWFLLNQEYIAQRNREMQNIDIESDRAYLGPWTTERTELLYNQGTAYRDSSRLVCLDQNEIVLTDGGSIEPCDLLTVDGHFIHVKDWKSSQTFSALMKQGENSAQLLESSEEFRQKLFEKLPSLWKRKPLWKRLAAGIPASELRIVFAVAAEPARSIPASLPFFSRMSLLDTCSSLRARYFNVRVCHIHRTRARTPKGGR